MIPTNRMVRVATPLVAALLVAPGVARAGAQALAARVHAVSGDAELRFAARPGVCGDGEQMVSYRSPARARESWSEWEQRCEPGPIRLRLTVRDGAVTAIHTAIGTRRPPPNATTDLGTVSDRAAVDYLLELARTAAATVAKDAVTPAALADSVTVTPELLTLAQDRARPVEVRKRALFWAGQLGEGGVIAPVARVANDSSEDRALREQAVFVLSQLPDGDGVSVLASIVRGNGAPWLASKAAFWLGQIDDARARAVVRDLVTGAGVNEEVKGQAVFVMGQHDSPGDQAFLRQHFDALGSERVQDRALMGVAQHGGPDGTAWLLGIARDSARPVHVRKQALFRAGQGSTSTADFVDFYQTVHDEALQKQVIFVLSQRDDSTATGALIDIARSDPSHELRKQAMFWLGQKNDPRAAKFLADILEH